MRREKEDVRSTLPHTILLVEFLDLEIETSAVEVVPERVKVECARKEWTGHLGQWMEIQPIDHRPKTAHHCRSGQREA